MASARSLAFPCAIAACASPQPAPPAAVAKVPTPPLVAPRTWRPLAQLAPFPAAGQSFLLTDGTVMVQDLEASDMWKLTPDATGSYANGTWSQLASLPPGYAPLYVASAVLPDGRVIMEGGEYNGGFQDWTTLGAIYDPVADAWTAIVLPAQWA